MLRDKVFVMVLTALTSLWSPLRAGGNMATISVTTIAMMTISVTVMTTLVVMRSTTAASLSERPRADSQTSQGGPPLMPETNVTCYLNQTCSLRCPADGDVEEFHFTFGNKPVPAAYYPANGRRHQLKDFQGITSVSLPPGGVAVLQLRGVQRKHEGRYKCTVTLSSGGVTKQYINLQVEHAPDRSHLHFLWLLLIVVVVGLFCLVYFCHVKVPQNPTGSKQQNGQRPEESNSLFKQTEEAMFPL